jgi:hypothetical protein
VELALYRASTERVKKSRYAPAGLAVVGGVLVVVLLAGAPV